MIIVCHHNLGQSVMRTEKFIPTNNWRKQNIINFFYYYHHYGKTHTL